jgi:hypothetical protein
MVFIHAVERVRDHWLAARAWQDAYYALPDGARLDRERECYKSIDATIKTSIPTISLIKHSL